MIRTTKEATIVCLENLHKITCPTCPNEGGWKREVYPRIENGCRRCTRVVGYDDALANTLDVVWPESMWVVIEGGI